MTNNNSVVFDKAEQITQIAVNGVQMADVAAFVSLNLDSLRRELTEHMQRVNADLQARIETLSKQRGKCLSISDLGTFRAYIKMLETYSDRPDEDLGAVLCDVLANSLDAERASVLRTSLLEAVDTARLLNQSQLRLLAFIFLLRNCWFTAVDSLKSFETLVKDVIWTFRPTDLSSPILPKHLEFSKCTTFVAREMLISRMLTNSYLPALQTTEGEIKSRADIVASVGESLNTNALPETSRLSRQVFDIHQISQDMNPRQHKNDNYTTRRGRENIEAEKIVVELIKSLEDGERVYAEWATSPIKNHVLTPVGMVLAISTLRNELGYDFPYAMWIH